MNFQEAMQIIKAILHNCGTEINISEFDGLIVKKLAASNTLDEGRRTNQTHIAITGEQMDIFPHLCADGYFFDGNTIVNEELKKYFILKIKTILSKSNCDYLGNTTEIDFQTNTLESYTCVIRSKRASQHDQLQLSMLTSDGKDFIEFRKLLHEGFYIIILKCHHSMSYYTFGIKPTDGNETLERLNNKFFKAATQTIVDADSFVPNLPIDTPQEADFQGSNELFYGVPGSGKSYTIDNIISDSDYERVVFHPDYTYSDFVGQIMPRLKMNEDGTEKLTYEFVPGPFTKALKTAEDDKEHMHYLIIEEINRGNAPAIFGDIFQLLDRDENGQGKYCITNYDIAREVFGEENETAAIRIPSNLSILATMNTSDQNVFTLDTAFQRRWNMKYIENNITGAAHANDKIEHSDITWGSFASVVNEEILEYNAGLASSEDKQLGAYFVGKDELSSDRFPEKALKYLWDDAFKLERDKIFNQEIKSIGDIISSYEKNIQQGNDPIKGVLKWEVYKKMMDMSADSIEEAIDESEVFEAETIDGE